MYLSGLLKSNNLHFFFGFFVTSSIISLIYLMLFLELAKTESRFLLSLALISSSWETKSSKLFFNSDNSNFEKSIAYWPSSNISRTSWYLWLQPIRRTGTFCSREPIIAWNLEATKNLHFPMKALICSASISSWYQRTLSLLETSL